MAISVVGGSFLDWDLTGVPAFTMPVPAGTVAGDVIILTATVTSSLASTPFTTPANASILVTYSNYATDSVSTVTYLWICPSTPPANITVSMSSSQQGALSWLHLRGVDTTTPLASPVGLRNFSSGTSTTGIAPAVTTTVANSFIVGGLILGSGGSDYTQTAPSGWTIQARALRRISISAYKGNQAVAGTTGTASWGVGINWLAPRAWQVALRSATGGAPAGLLHTITGNQSSSGFTASFKTDSTTSVRVKAATDTGLTTGVVYGTAATPDADGWAKSTVTGLSAGTTYYYGAELTSASSTVTTTPWSGKVQTLKTAGVPGSVRIGWGSCWEPLATPGTGIPSFARLLARAPDMFFHCGDFHYDDDGSTSQSVHRVNIEDVLNHTNAAGLRSLMSQVASYRLLSDHDGSDGNDGGVGAWTDPNRAANKQVFPYPTLNDSNGLYYSFVSGRVRIIVTDHEYLLGPSTVMGATQKAWFKTQLQQPEPVKVWVQEGAWLKKSTEGGDGWVTALAERIELGDFIRDEAIGQVVTIHGGQHAISADNGSGNPFGGFPVMCAAPFYNWTYEEVTESGWNQGIYPTDGNTASQYGILDIADTGSAISLTFNGYDSSDVSRVNMVINVDTSITGSVALSGSGTLGLSGGKNVTGTLGLSGSGTLATAGGKNVSSSLALSGSGALAAAGGKNVSGSLGLSGSGTLTRAGGKNVSGALGLSGSGTLGVAPSNMSVSASRSLSGSGTLGLSGSGAQDATGSIALSGGGTLGLIGSKSVTGSIALSGSGALTTNGLPGWSKALSVSGSGTLGLTSPGMSASTALGFSGSGTLGLAGGKNVSGALSLSGAGSLTTTSAFNIKQTQALSGSGTLARTATGMSQSGSLSLSGSGLLQPAGEGEQVGSGTLTGSGSGALTFTGRVSTSGVTALSGIGTLGLVGSKNVSSSVGFTGSGTLALVTVTLSTAGSRAFSGIGTLALSGAGSAEGSGSISLAGAGSLGIVGHPAFSSTINLTGAGSLGLLGTGSSDGSGTVTLSGVGNLVFSATEVKTSGSRALTGVGTLTLVGGASSGEGALELSGAGSLTLLGDDDGFQWPAVITLVGVRYSVTLTPVYDSNSLVGLDHSLDLDTTES